MTGGERELREAIDAGETALRHLSGAIVALEEAETYGTWDLFQGPWFLHSRKYALLRKAQEQTDLVSDSLKRYGRSLGNVRVLPSQETWIWDVVFDNVVTDKCVLDDIRSCRRKLLKLEKKVEKRQEKLLREWETMKEQM